MLRSFLPLALALLAAGPARAQTERRFEDAALAPFAQQLSAYFEARSSATGLEAARVALAASLAELRTPLQGDDPLRCERDLARALWLARTQSGEKARPGKIVSETFTGGSFRGAGLEYAWRLPDDYDPARTAWPLILTIPDADETPADHLRANWTHRELLDGAILVCPAMPKERAEWDRVMVAGRPGGLCHVLTVLRLASERFALDPERVYVAGRGKGVPAALAAGDYAPQRFAGVIGRAGDAGDLGPANFANLPTWFSGAGAKARAFQEACASAGHDNCRLEPLGKEEELWSWIGNHARATFPAQVTLQVGQPFPTRVYWLRVAPSASDARASASIERETNTVRIDGNGISHATLYLNDALVDLERPVRVICNGVETSSLVRRSLSTALDLIHDGTSDAGCVYVAETSYDMSGTAAPAPTAADAEQRADFERRLAEAGSDVAALWSLHEQCAASERADDDRIVLRRIVRLAPDHEGARTALGHVRSELQWFTSPEALARFEARQDPAAASAAGNVEHESLWMHPDERALANKAWIKDQESGLWLSVSDRKRLAEGQVLQDTEWIEPDEAANVDAGLWRIGGEWFELREANRRHAQVDAMWRIPSAEVLLYSTADRDVSLRAMSQMARALPDLRRVFGAEPVLPLSVAVLRDEEQYDRFAFGDPDGKRPATHAGRLHVLHSAFFAESWFQPAERKLVHRGMGVCYWDALVPNGELYGVHSARLAVGLSYVDALDPSPKAVKKASAAGPGAEYYADFQAEKKLPAWLRYGGAVYAERYFRDASVGPDGDPWWARKWSLDNLRNRGGLRVLAEVLAFELDPDEREDGSKLLLEAGLLVAFIVDGECAPVVEAHAALKKALVSGRLHPNQIEALTAALVANEAELRAFGGL